MTAPELTLSSSCSLDLDQSRRQTRESETVGSNDSSLKYYFPIVEQSIVTNARTVHFECKNPKQIPRSLPSFHSVSFWNRLAMCQN